MQLSELRGIFLPEGLCALTLCISVSWVVKCVFLHLVLIHVWLVTIFVEISLFRAGTWWQRVYMTSEAHCSLLGNPRVAHRGVASIVLFSSNSDAILLVRGSCINIAFVGGDDNSAHNTELREHCVPFLLVKFPNGMSVPAWCNGSICLSETSPMRSSLFCSS